MALDSLAYRLARTGAAQLVRPVPARHLGVGVQTRAEVQVELWIRRLGPQPLCLGRLQSAGQKSGVISVSSSGLSDLTEQMTSSASSGPSLWTER
jgi:hypothetical protein